MAQLLGVEGVAEQQKEGRRSDSPLPTCVGWTALRQADSPLHVWGVRRREDHTRRLIRSRINRTHERTNPRYASEIGSGERGSRFSVSKMANLLLQGLRFFSSSLQTKHQHV